MDYSDDVYLEHIGIKRKSGRYPWGTGNTPYQRSVGFKGYMEEMKAKGLSQSDIAKGIEEYVNANRKEGERYTTFKTTDLRAAISASTSFVLAENSSRASLLAKKGLSNGAIAEAMGLPRSAESTVRGWLKTGTAIKEGSLQATVNVLKEHNLTKPFLDVGKGTELYMGIADTKLRQALALLKDEGYGVHPLKAPQLGTGNQTELKVLTKPGVTWQEARKAVLDEGRLQNVTDHSDDGGLHFMSPKTMPVSINPKRVEVRYKDDGGDKLDGVIEVRRGVEELNLEGKNYAQVRIAVGGTHYLKGMAMYADDLPTGVDMRFNTNKTKAEAPTKLDAMKPLKVSKQTGEIDTENPFGSSTYPRMYKAGNGHTKQSCLNIVGARGSGNIEGRWDDWALALSSQMLSKQSLTLASTQLGKEQTKHQESLDEINALTNPVVKKKLLDEFADSADAAAVHLKAASLPRQTTAVILPMSSVKPHEIYAPNHEHGEKVVLVRHPHGGPFEIPELTVNNRNVQARRLIPAAKDAVGIHHTVAQQLSGADFDGDTVLVIPNNTRSVKHLPPLQDLKNFEPRELYAIPKGDTSTTRMSKKSTQTEMGKISNLITDMTIHKASPEELSRAIRHSMVVIDAEKHELNYKQSAKDHNIAQLKERYQGINPKTGQPNGAATLISRSSSEQRVPDFKARPAKDGGPVDAKTGELRYVPTDRKNPVTGEPKIKKVSRMELAKDARDLLSSKTNPQPMEEVYAAHANAMKAMANEARKIAHPDNLKMPLINKAAQQHYAKEVQSLKAKLAVAERNAPLERKAQVVGGAIAKARIRDNPELDKDDIKKYKYQELDRARLATGAAKLKIGSEHSPLTEREWEAVQAGAISSTVLRSILANADIDRVKELATPRTSYSVSTAQLQRAKTLMGSGKPLSEIAALLGIPRSTLSDNLARS